MKKIAFISLFALISALPSMAQDKWETASNIKESKNGDYLVCSYEAWYSKYRFSITTDKISCPLHLNVNPPKGKWKED